MTVRELIKELESIDDKYQDLPVEISSSRFLYIHNDYNSKERFFKHIEINEPDIIDYD